MSSPRSLDQKLEVLRADPASPRAFILCDAKDPDMAFGLPATGDYAPSESPDRNWPYRSREEFLGRIGEVVAQGVVDVVLMSPSTSERLVLEERLFEGSTVTPAVRLNDTTDIYQVRGGAYPRVASRPFRSATLDQIQCGKVQCAEEERRRGPDLGLYSITFNNCVERDLASLEAYKHFRLEAEAQTFRHFLEVFAPNVPEAVPADQLGHFINDSIVRTLAGVPTRSRPLFLKTVYLGPRFLEELVHYDPTLIIGVMGGAAGTTFDAFDLLDQARRHGARAALFGRKINQAEHQPAFIACLRLVADGEASPAEAVRAYHGVLERLAIRPRRPLSEDLQPTVDLMAGDELSTASVVVPESWGGGVEGPPAPTAGPRPAPAADEEPDFEAMTPAQKLAYNQRRRDRIFG